MISAISSSHSLAAQRVNKAQVRFGVGDFLPPPPRQEGIDPHPSPSSSWPRRPAPPRKTGEGSYSGPGRPENPAEIAAIEVEKKQTQQPKPNAKNDGMLLALSPGIAILSVAAMCALGAGIENAAWEHAQRQARVVDEKCPNPVKQFVDRLVYRLIEYTPPKRDVKCGDLEVTVPDKR